MHKDFLVSFSGVDFPCVDRGFAREQSVQVVVRPEDIEVVSPVEGQLVGVVNDVIFKGVHFEMHVECEGREWLIHSTRACTPGETIGMRIGPNEIHIMARSEGDVYKRQDITGVPPYKRPVNTVFQKYALFPHLKMCIRDRASWISTSVGISRLPVS